MQEQLFFAIAEGLNDRFGIGRQVKLNELDGLVYAERFNGICKSSGSGKSELVGVGSRFRGDCFVFFNGEYGIDQRIGSFCFEDFKSGRTEKSINEHKALYNAIKGKDVELAKKLVNEHILNARESILGGIK